MSAISRWSKAFLSQLSKRAFRAAYMADQVRTGIAYQIRTMREQPERRWTQNELGSRMDKPQSTVARLENPDYGKVTLSTLLDVAKAMDVALLVQFVEWPEFLDRMEDVSPQALRKSSFDISSLTTSQAQPSTTDIFIAVIHGATQAPPKIIDYQQNSSASISPLSNQKFAGGSLISLQPEQSYG